MLPDRPRAGPSRVRTAPHGTHAEQSRGHAEDSAGPGASSPQRRRHGAPRPPDPADGSVMQGTFWNSRHGGDGCRAHTTAPPPRPAGSSVQHAPLLLAATLAELPPRLGLGRHWPLSREPPPSPIPTDLPRPDEGAQGPRKKGVGSGHRQGADGEAGLVGREATWRVGRRPAAAEAEQRHRRAADGPLQTVHYRRAAPGA